MSHIVSNMKTVTVREAQHRLGALLESVQRGREVIITKRGKPVAKVVPAESDGKTVVWPDFEARLRNRFPDGVPGGPSLSEIVSDGRGER